MYQFFPMWSVQKADKFENRWENNSNLLGINFFFCLFLLFELVTVRHTENKDIFQKRYVNQGIAFISPSFTVQWTPFIVR